MSIKSEVAKTLLNQGVKLQLEADFISFLSDSYEENGHKFAAEASTRFANAKWTLGSTLEEMGATLGKNNFNNEVTKAWETKISFE